MPGWHQLIADRDRKREMDAGSRVRGFAGSRRLALKPLAIRHSPTAISDLCGHPRRGERHKQRLLSTADWPREQRPGQLALFVARPRKNAKGSIQTRLRGETLSFLKHIGPPNAVHLGSVCEGVGSTPVHLAFAPRTAVHISVAKPVHAVAFALVLHIRAYVKNEKSGLSASSLVEGNILYLCIYIYVYTCFSSEAPIGALQRTRQRQEVLTLILLAVGMRVRAWAVCSAFHEGSLKDRARRKLHCAIAMRQVLLKRSAVGLPTGGAQGAAADVLAVCVLAREDATVREAERAGPVALSRGEAAVKLVAVCRSEQSLSVAEPIAPLPAVLDDVLARMIRAHASPRRQVVHKPARVRVAIRILHLPRSARDDPFDLALVDRAVRILDHALPLRHAFLPSAAHHSPIAERVRATAVLLVLPPFAGEHATGCVEVLASSASHVQMPLAFVDVPVAVVVRPSALNVAAHEVAREAISVRGQQRALAMRLILEEVADVSVAIAGVILSGARSPTFLIELADVLVSVGVQQRLRFGHWLGARLVRADIGALELAEHRPVRALRKLLLGRCAVYWCLI
eukprot:scaffold8074_cov258-Pinguiococcus_pyrenoidosus.AAC.1